MLLFRPLPRPGRPPPVAAEEDATGAAGAGTEEDEDDAAKAGAAPGDERRPLPGLRPLAGAGGCGCGCGFSDMVSGPYTGSYAGRGQPGAERAEETPEHGGDARTPSGQARAGAVAGARGSRTTTKGRGGPQTPNSRREPDRDAPLRLMEAGQGKLTVQVALERGCGGESSASHPGAAWGSQAVGRLQRDLLGRRAPGSFVSQRLEYHCPLVATRTATNRADSREQFPSAWTQCPRVTGTHRLLQGLHQGLIGLDTDLDLGPCGLIRRARQL